MNGFYPVPKRNNFRLLTWNQRAGLCFYCHGKFPLGKWTIDHIVPLSRGGTKVDANKVGCCVDCNLQKADRPFIEFVRSDFVVQARKRNAPTFRIYRRHIRGLQPKEVVA